MYGLVILVHRNIQVMETFISAHKIYILYIDETKHDTSFPESQFKIGGYQFLLITKN